MEVYIKWTAILLQSAIYEIERDEANHVGAMIARANSIGEWTRTIDLALAASRRNASVAHLTSHRHSLESSRADLAGVDLPLAVQETRQLLDLIGDPELRFPRNRIGILRVLVAARNATRGHGALPSGQYRLVNPCLARLLDELLSSEFSSQGRLLYVQDRQPGGSANCLVLEGLVPGEHRLERLPQAAGAELWFEYPAGPSLPLAPLVYFDCDRLAFYFANGAIDTNGFAEFLDYSTGDRKHVSLGAFAAIPPARPPSTTAGRTVLEYTETIAHNLPDSPLDYVDRTRLQARLHGYLTDPRNRLITLQGPGGAGKTSLALATLNNLVSPPADAPFDVILWCSARDIDLLEGAPRRTRRAISDLQSLADLFCKLTESQAKGEAAVGALALALEGSTTRHLLVLDNFETVDAPEVLYSFLNDHATLPNRVLITAREHSFSGDQVLPVSGMEPDEGASLIAQEAGIRGCAEKITDAVAKRIHEACSGNPYAMKLIVAQLATSSDLQRIIRTTFERPDLQQALCQRAFEELGDSWGAYLFLLLGSLEFDPLESLLHIASARRNFRLDDARQSLLDRALAEAGVTAGGERMLTVAGLHQAFARRHLIGSAHEAIVAEDARLLTEMRPDPRFVDTSTLVQWLVEKSVAAQRAGERDRCRELLTGLSAVATAEPQFMAAEARALAQIGSDPVTVRGAYKRSLEWDPTNSATWLEWEEYERGQGDPLEQLRVLSGCANSCPTDIGLNLHLAARIADVFNSAKHMLPSYERTAYLRQCRENLLEVLEELDVSGISRLAWLFLLDDDRQKARELVEVGLTRPRAVGNVHLQRLRERLALD